MLNQNNDFEEKVKDTKHYINQLQVINADMDNTLNESICNVLITNVSMINKLQKKEYLDEERNFYSAQMTNEAPIKSISHRLGQRGEYLNKIFFIESTTVQSRTININGHDYTSGAYLKEKIEEFLGDYKGKTEFISIGIEDEPSANDVSSSVFDIYRKLLKLCKEKEKVNIYVESNGGVRYVLTLLLSLTKTLENYYDNVMVSEVTSMIVNKTPVRIINSKVVYDTAQITGIVDEFVNYGRTNILERYIHENMSELKEEQKKDIKDVLWILNKMSNDIQLCRTSRLMEDFYGEDGLPSVMNPFIEKYSEKDTNSKNENKMPAVISILVHILQLIKEEMKEIYKNVDFSSPILHLPNVIEWSLDKSFIQQALTFCSENFPKYLLESGQVKLNADLKEKLDAKHNENDHNKSYEISYYFIAHIHEFREAFMKEQIDIIKANLLNHQLKNPEEADILELIEEYKEKYDELNNCNSSTKVKSILVTLLTNHGFKEEDLEKPVAISNKLKTSLSLACLGKYNKKDKNTNQVEIANHPNLTTMANRIDKILPTLIRIKLDYIEEENIKEAEGLYRGIIDEIFEENEPLKEALKLKYATAQSRKYHLRMMMRSNNNGEAPAISSSLDDDTIQKLLYVYSICKEQRNMSNHANVSEEDQRIALDSQELGLVIRKLIELCHA